MERHLRNAPTYAVVVALVIQVTRVSDFGDRIGAGWLAWVYAIFLALTIYTLSYWVARLKYEVTADPEDKRQYAQQQRMQRLYHRARVNALVWLSVFLVIDGLLNLAETMAALPEAVSTWELAGAVVYGVFPTLAAFGLGSLQSMIDRIPAGASKPSAIGQLAGKLLARLDASWAQGEQVTGKADKQGEQVAGKVDKQEPALQGQDEQVAGKAQKQELALRKQPMQDDALLAYWQSNPQASDKQVAEHFGVSRQAVQQRRKSLTERGAFLSMTPSEVQA